MTKYQGPNKSQRPNSNFPNAKAVPLSLDHWSFVLVWSLVIGAWSFPPPFVLSTQYSVPPHRHLCPDCSPSSLIPLSLLHHISHAEIQLLDFRMRRLNVNLRKISLAASYRCGPRRHFDHNGIPNRLRRIAQWLAQLRRKIDRRLKRVNFHLRLVPVRPLHNHKNRLFLSIFL